jgi:succinate dehydrogenase / fumarate reductase flavoprotein subunit
MQGLPDGYFVLPYTIGSYLSSEIRTGDISTDTLDFEAAEKDVKDRINQLMSIKGTQSVESFHRRLGKIMWDKCGMGRTAEGLTQAIQEIRDLRAEFWKDVLVPGRTDEYNPELEKAWRVADFIELGELMCIDALRRDESCGGHFREEFQTPEGEALRNDQDFMFVSAWEWKGEGAEPELHKEVLEYEEVKVTQRSYK